MKTNNVLSVAVVAVVIGFLAGWVSCGMYLSDASKAGGGKKLVSKSEAKDFPSIAKGLEGCPVKGPKHAKVNIVEVSDFQ